MCWKTLTLMAVIVVAVLLMMPSSSVDKEGFVTYIVYGPGWGGPSGWPYGYRPYWRWRRRHWGGPCPGPWCPYF
jgi:hypothetical protein